MMIAELTSDPQFKELEKEYKFLARARGNAFDAQETVLVDIETTGLDFTQNEITEIGALKILGSEIKGVFSTLIKPQATISAEITRLTGIDNEMVKDYPPAEAVLPKFIDFIGSDVLIAHNVDFDIPFLKHHLKKLNNIELSNETICTLKLARFLLPNLVNHKLHTVAAHFNIPVANRHRALGDVELTFQVWQQFIDLLKGKGILHKRELDSLISRL